MGSAPFCTWGWAVVHETEHRRRNTMKSNLLFKHGPSMYNILWLLSWFQLLLRWPAEHVTWNVKTWGPYWTTNNYYYETLLFTNILCYNLIINYFHLWNTKNLIYIPWVVGLPMVMLRTDFTWALRSRVETGSKVHLGLPSVWICRSFPRPYIAQHLCVLLF